nr:M6 family metalloprotease domain-containing protein [candidate division Zixibacteria bacterium]
MSTVVKIGISTLVIMLAVMIGVEVHAVQITPEAREKLEIDGLLQDYITILRDAKTLGLNSAGEIDRPRRMATSSDDVDTLTIMVLLVDFADSAYTAGDVAGTVAEFDSILFSTGRLNPTGSMTEYYLENSYGKMLIKGQVYGWLRMPRPYFYYVDGQGGIGSIFPTNSRGLAYDAINVADSVGIDFSLFDTYGPSGMPDGEIDGLAIVHAGPGMELTGNLNDMASHKWDLGSYATYKDGIYINEYTIQPEEYYSSASLSPIGVFCHEFGHVLGLPDLYDIDYDPSTSAGVGLWSVMGTGVYKGAGRIPSHFDAWCKTFLGFVDPIEVYSNLTDVEIPQAENNPVVYRLWKNGVYGPEYFLVENRQKTGFDSLLIGEGLLIYHVDDNATFNNTNVNRYHVAVEQADGQYQLEYAANNEGDPGDPWPGSTAKRSFDDLTVPSSRGYGNVITEVAVWDISDSDSLMTANLDIEWSRPNLELYTYDFSDENLNGLLEPGEMVEFHFQIKNYWLTAGDVTVSMTSNDPGIIFSTPSVDLAYFLGDGYVTSSTAPIIMEIPDTLTPTFDSFYVHIESDGGNFDFNIEQQVGKAQILIVDDDRGSSYDTLYVGDLYRRLIPADIWHKATSGTPPAVVLNDYEMVFWFTGDTSLDLLQTNDINAIRQYLDNQGKLFLTGQGLAGELHAEDSAFLENYLHARYVSDLFSPFQDGVDGSPIGNGLQIRYYSDANQIYTWAEKIEPVNGAVPVFHYRYYTDGYTSLSFAGSYKVVFFDWGYEGIDNNSSKFDGRDTVLAGILNFFGDFTTALNDNEDDVLLPRNFELGQNYPNPFNPTTTISYTIRQSDSHQMSNTVLTIFNLLGQEVRTLVDQPQRPGNYQVEWDGADNNGFQAASGIYFYRLNHGNDAETKKMMLLK